MERTNLLKEYFDSKKEDNIQDCISQYNKYLIDNKLI